MDGDHARAGSMASIPLSNPYVCAGQAIWAKGYTELLALMDADHARAGDAGTVPVDCYGSGEDLEEVGSL